MAICHLCGTGVASVRCAKCGRLVCCNCIKGGLCPFCAPVIPQRQSSMQSCHLCKTGTVVYRCPKCGRLICPACAKDGLCLACVYEGWRGRYDSPVDNSVDKSTHLQQAAQSGQNVLIIYHGGSQPGTKRRVLPVAIKPHLVAFDHVAGKELTFDMEKVEIYDGRKTAPDFVQDDRPTPKQIEFAHDLGIRIPKNTTKDQLSILIDKKLGKA